MNRCLRVWVVSFLSGLFSVTAIRPVAAQVPPTLAPPAGLPAGGTAAAPTAGMPADAQSNTVESPTDLLAINTFVQTQFTALAGTDSVAQTNARKALIAQLGRGATPAYYIAFSNAWLKNASALLVKNPSVSVRLNIAIVTQTLTDNGMVLQTQPLVLSLINDKEPCVVLWGIKAARPLLKGILQLPPNGGKPAILSNPTVGAIVAAVKRTGNSDISGFITIDAYGALAIKPTDIPGGNQSQIALLVPPLVGPILDILEFRLSQFKTGVIPASGGKLGGVQAPGAEHDIGTFLSTNYPQVLPADQKRTVQDLVTLVTYLGQRAPLYQYDKDNMAQIRDALRYCASPLKVIVPSSAGGLTWLLSPPPSATPDEILAHTKLVYNLIHSDPGFTFIVQPPDVVAIEPPPAPEVPKPAATATPGVTPRP